jgi:hypothetical protein
LHGATRGEGAIRVVVGGEDEFWGMSPREEEGWVADNVDEYKRVSAITAYVPVISPAWVPANGRRASSN